MTDGRIVAGNNGQKHRDLGDAESLGIFTACRVAALSLRMGGTAWAAACQLGSFASGGVLGGGKVPSLKQMHAAVPGEI